MTAMKASASTAWKTQVATCRPAERAGCHADADEGAAERPADRRPRRPPRLDHREPARLHDEAAHVDHEQQREHPREARGRVDARRPLDEAPPHRHAETDHEEEPEQVEHGLVEEVERALQELVAEERQRDVPVERGERRPHEQGEEAPEHDRVHDARIRLRERADLAERVSQDAADALGNAIQAILGEAARARGRSAATSRTRRSRSRARRRRRARPGPSRERSRRCHGTERTRS